ncbi:Alpha/Beta hydrolase protein [Chytriomyces cf. hyalinus JEL632]|nr:Alpha/Beta hydrolase protein [Chytriomyces cf. hyalinus JEL632]
MPLYRTALDKTKNSVKYTRSLLSFVPTSVPDNIQVTHAELPRRSDILLDGMAPEETHGTLHAEWVVHGPANRSTITKPADETIILYCHGGAFFMGSPSTTRNLTSLFSEHSGSRVLSVGYRLAPENPFPLPLHDAVSAYLSLIDPPSGSYKPEGGLVIALALWIRDNGPARGWKMPAGIVALAPWLDLTHSQPSFHLNTLDYLSPIVSDPSYITKGHRSHYYTPHDSLNSHPYVSPLFANDSPTDKSTHLSPTLFQLGSLERLRDEGLMFAADSFKHSPVRVELYEDMVHIFQTFATRGDIRAKDVFERIGEFVKRVGAAGVSASRAKESAEGFVFVGEDYLEEIGRTGVFDIVREARRELDAVSKMERQTIAPSSQSRWIQNDTSLSSKLGVSL